ncbi:hypothetical protein FHT67_006027 [Paenibacillus sp. BK720]|nr:hypothetical protein [Paenibacillus sp. BK720]
MVTYRLFFVFHSIKNLIIHNTILLICHLTLVN